LLTDTHCHLDLDLFDSDREAVLERAARAGVERILIPGLSVSSSRAVVQLAANHPMLFAAVGVHPSEALTWETSTLADLRNLALSGISDGSKTVAIGEIGLDYYWEGAPHDHQRMVLKEQLDLAASLNLPVILHLREARDASTGLCAEDMLNLLEPWVAGLKAEKSPLAERPGVLHSYAGTLETARAALELGFFIGVTGPVTFKNARARQEVVAGLPLDRLLIETDAPFLAPHPQRGKRNEPAYVGLIADKIGLLHSRSSEEIASLTSANASRLFSWIKTV
jgi:TatD DNase family protein